jgi:hypothetical protein
MTLAECVFSTPPTNTSAISTIPYVGVRNLESSVCDLAHMAGVNSTLLEDLASGHPLHEQHVEQFKFTAYHLERMIKAFKVQYYEVLAGKEVA